MAQQIGLNGLRLALGVIGAVSLVGCSSVLGIDSERSLATDNNTGPLPAEWACLRDPVPAASKVPVKQTFHFFDGSIANFPSVAGLTVRACQRIDFDCANPVAPGVVTGEDGLAVVTVPSGFTGFFEAFGRDDYQSIIMVERVANSEIKAEVSVVTKAVSAAYAAAAGTMYQEGMGNMTLIVRDCEGKPGTGISFDLKSSSSTGSVVYLVNSLPTAGATATDASGVAVDFSLPPGALNASASASDGSFTVATRPGLARAGWLTQLSFYPDQLSLAP